MSDSELKSVNGNDKGNETFVKEQQHYLLYRLINILVAAQAGTGSVFSAYDLDFNPGTTNRLKRLDYKDSDANYKLAASLARTQNIKYLREIPPNVIAGLMPLVKIYKIVNKENYRFVDERFHEEVGSFGFKGKIDPNVQDAYEIPFDDTVTRNVADGFTTAIEYEDVVLNGRKKGYLDLANLASFDYQYIGTNPAETEACITAKMKLKFQTIDALLEERIIGNFTLSRPRLEEKDLAGRVIRVVEGGNFNLDVKFKYSDLVNQSKRDDPLYYRIKVVVGYQKVEKKFIKDLLADGGTVGSPGARHLDEYAQNFTNAINNSRVAMYLYPVRHELNFTENGTIEMGIDFHGAIEGMMSDRDMNILLSGREGEAIIKKIKEVEKERQEKIKAQNTRIEENPDSKDELERQKEQIQKDYDQKIKEQYADAPKLYKDFINSIYGSGKIYSINYDPTAIGVDISSASAFGYEVSLASKVETGTKPVADMREARNTSGADTTNLGFRKEDATYINARVAALGEAADKTSGKSKGTTENSSSPKPAVQIEVAENRIRFIFLSDLIAQALKIIGNSKLSQEDLYIVLGNILVPVASSYRTAVNNFLNNPGISASNPLKTLFQNSVFYGDATTDAYAIQINLGMLPISLEFFNRWFFETVVKPAKIEYPLRNFLYDIIDLIRISTLQIFGKKTFGTTGSRILSSITTVDSSYGSLLETNPGPVDLVKAMNKVVPENPARTTNIMYFFVPTVLTSQVDPLNPIANDGRGIFTFTVGSTTGLLKKLSYKKQDIPGMREARATQDGEISAGVLRMKYDADIEMYGPSYFRPGDLVVINPVFLTKQSYGASTTSLAKDLGLGGVYMVLRTNTDVSRDGIKTKLDTVFQAYGSRLPRTTK